MWLTRVLPLFVAGSLVSGMANCCDATYKAILGCVQTFQCMYIMISIRLMDMPSANCVRSTTTLSRYIWDLIRVPCYLLIPCLYFSALRLIPPSVVQVDYQTSGVTNPSVGTAVKKLLKDTLAMWPDGRLGTDLLRWTDRRAVAETRRRGPRLPAPTNRIERADIVRGLQEMISAARTARSFSRRPVPNGRPTPPHVLPHEYLFGDTRRVLLQLAARR